MLRLHFLAAALPVFAAVVHAQGPMRQPLAGAPATPTAFIDVGVVPLNTERVLVRQTVLVEGGWITAIGPSDKVKVPAGATRIDGQRKYLIPGLSECHAHLGLFVKRKNDVATAEYALFLLLASGVTTVRNLDYSKEFTLDGNTLLQLRARAKGGELWSPRIYTSAAWWGEGTLRPGLEPEAVTRLLTAYKAAEYDFVKVRDEDSVTFHAVVKTARTLGIPIVGHVPKYVSLEQALAIGYTSIEHGKGYIIPGRPDTSLFSTHAAATKRSGVWNCLTARGMHLNAQLGKALHDAGAGLLLGTDAPIGRIMGFSVHRELATLVRAGLTPYQALLTGTQNMAQYLGELDESGTIAVGKRADLMLLTGNPLQDIRHTLPPAGVMIGGRWLSPEAINQQLAALASKATVRRDAVLAPEGEPLQHLAIEQRKNIYADDAEYALWRLWSSAVDHKQLSTDQSGAIAQVKKVYEPAMIALIDSILSSAEPLNGQRRILQLVAQRLKEQRAILTPEQQALFDTKADAWIRRYAE